MGPWGIGVKRDTTMKTYLATHIKVVLDLEGKGPEERQTEAQEAVAACLASLTGDQYMTYGINFDFPGGRTVEEGIKPDQLSQEIKKYARNPKYTWIAILGVGYLIPWSPLSVLNERDYR